MSINRMIWQSLKKNIRNYYLYVFALVFSVALYFSFVTLQYDPALEEKSNTVKGAAGIGAGSILLIVIVAVFLLYANNLFIKRRSQEIGLFQLIGMTKGKVFRILSIENIALYIGSLIIGIFIGFAGSKLIKMVFFKLTGINEIAGLNFSGKALIQTVLVFLVIYLFIMLMNYWFIKSQSVLSLFRSRSKTENNVQKLSIFQVLIGLLGIGLIILGYYLSTTIFDSDLTEATSLLLLLVSILGSVILGTYLFFKGSVSFILQVIRKSKAGYLSINNVMSLSSIMFRMKSNALLLTVITTVSALAIGLLSLTYISYYSSEKMAQQMAPNDFAITDVEDADSFTEELDTENIDYDQTKIDILTVSADIVDALDSLPMNFDGDLEDTHIDVISDESVSDIDVSSDEAILTGVSNAVSEVVSFKDKGSLTLFNEEDDLKLHFKDPEERSILPQIMSMGFAVAVVDDHVYQELAAHADSEDERPFGSTYVGIDINDDGQLDEANDIFLDWYDEEGNPAYSHSETVAQQKQAMGLIMFIVGFLGLTFLITSGCIIYFKQMGESEEEQPIYTILRKLGFTQGDLVHGIWYKQLFNFGIPLILGLLHSYFAVKSGWFLFGTEMVTPTVIVMGIYTVLYSIFGILSVASYKRVINKSL